MRDRIVNTKAMTNITCDETKNDIDFDNCSYSLKSRNVYKNYKYYTLGLLCNIQPGKSSIITSHIYLTVQSFMDIYGNEPANFQILTKLCTDLPKGINKRFSVRDIFLPWGKPRRATPILTQ